MMPYRKSEPVVADRPWDAQSDLGRAAFDASLDRRLASIEEKIARVGQELSDWRREARLEAAEAKRHAAWERSVQQYRAQWRRFLVVAIPLWAILELLIIGLYFR